MADIGTPDVTLQSLRPAPPSHLTAAGPDVLTISRRMGHSSPTGLYGHLFASTADRAAQIMEDTFAAVRWQSGAKPKLSFGHCVLCH